ncbi:Hypothetical predicted protein, partial [Olea europaea subsp. europaea]
DQVQVQAVVFEAIEEARLQVVPTMYAVMVRYVQEKEYVQIQVQAIVFEAVQAQIQIVMIEAQEKMMNLQGLLGKKQVLQARMVVRKKMTGKHPLHGGSQSVTARSQIY